MIFLDADASPEVFRSRWALFRPETEQKPLIAIDPKRPNVYLFTLPDVEQHAGDARAIDNGDDTATKERLDAQEQEIAALKEATQAREQENDQLRQQVRDQAEHSANTDAASAETKRALDAANEELRKKTVEATEYSAAWSAQKDRADKLDQQLRDLQTKNKFYPSGQPLPTPLKESVLERYQSKVDQYRMSAWTGNKDCTYAGSDDWPRRFSPYAGVGVDERANQIQVFRKGNVITGLKVRYSPKNDAYYFGDCGGNAAASLELDTPCTAVVAASSYLEDYKMVVLDSIAFRTAGGKWMEVKCEGRTKKQRNEFAEAAPEGFAFIGFWGQFEKAAVQRLGVAWIKT